MGAGTLTLSGTITGFPTGSRTVSVLFPLPAAIDVSLSVNLSTGDNQIPVPSGASMVIIEFPSGTSSQILLKSQPADAGVSLNPFLPTVYSIGSPQTSFYLNITQTLGGAVQLTFF